MGVHVGKHIVFEDGPRKWQGGSGKQCHLLVGSMGVESGSMGFKPRLELLLPV